MKRNTKGQTHLQVDKYVPDQRKGELLVPIGNVISNYNHFIIIIEWHIKLLEILQGNTAVG